MRKVILPLLALVMNMTAAIQAQEEGYVFTPVKELKITPVKNQNRTGTCWSYSGLGMLEAEIIRMGKGEHDLSEMFIVSHSYKDKAEKFVRLHGFLNFAQGGSFEDVLYAVKHYGIVPASEMRGLEYGENMHVHGELEAVAKGYVDAVIKNRNGKLSTAWKKGFDGIIDSYLGVAPDKFIYQGKEYTPESFAKDLGLDIDNYVSLTSFMHEPFYTGFAIEVQDNWRWGISYNLPLNELMEVLSNSIDAGYTIAWASDVSEAGFNREGIAVAPDVEYLETSGSDQARWIGLNTQQRNEEIRRLIQSPVKELTITQEMRQAGYDNYQTTDDHGMLIYGKAKDQTGKTFYMVKNSWGTDNKYQGTWYASEAFIAYKTLSIVVHKDAIPRQIRAKLSL